MIRLQLGEIECPCRMLVLVIQGFLNIPDLFDGQLIGFRLCFLKICFNNRFPDRKRLLRVLFHECIRNLFQKDCREQEGPFFRNRPVIPGKNVIRIFFIDRNREEEFIRRCPDHSFRSQTDRS